MAYRVKLFLAFPNRFRVETIPIPSDLLFSSMLNTYFIIYGEDLPDWFDKILISSIYPAVRFKNGDEIYLYQMPMLQIGDVKEENYALINRMKKFKKVKFVSENAWKLMGDCFANENFSEFWNEVEFYDKFLLTQKENSRLNNKELFQEIFIEGVVVDRESNRPISPQSPFVQEYVSFSRGEDYETFLYFYVDNIDKLVLKSYLEFILDEGIGGNRSTGAGAIMSYEIESMDIDLKSGNVLISRFIPNSNELKNLDESIIYYNIIKKPLYSYQRGKSYNLRKALIFMKEGSLFRKPLLGSIKKIILEEDKYIYRYGKGVYLKLGG